MLSRSFWLVASIVLLCGSLLDAGDAADDAKAKKPAGAKAKKPAAAKAKKPVGNKAKKITYDEHVRPILRRRCLSCHNQNKAKSDLALDTFGGMMQGGSSGEVIVPGKLVESRLWALVSHEDSPEMPPEQDKLPAAELAMIKLWIESGALQNSGSKAVINKPIIDLTLSAGGKRPSGPPPMPGRLSKEPLVLTQQPGAVTAIASSPWAPLIALAGHKQVLLYQPQTAELLGVLPFPEGRPHVLRFSRSGSLLLVGGGRSGLLGIVAVFDVKTGRRVFQVGDELDTVLAADINEDHTLIALGGPRKIVRVYSTKDGSLVHTIKKHTDWIYGIEFSPDGVLLATADRSGGLFVWEADTAREYLNLKGHRGAINDLSWRLDSNILASCGKDATIRLWEMNAGRQVRSWSAHGGGAATVDFTHDGRLVSSGRDRVTKIWDQAGKAQRSLEAFGDLGLEAVFTHDGKQVVAGDWSGEVRVWNVADGKRVANLSPNPPSLAVRLEAATKNLSARQQEHQSLQVAFQVAEAAAKKTQADLAAAEKGMLSAKQRLDQSNKAISAAKASLAAAASAHQAAAKAATDFQAMADKAKAAFAAALTVAAKAPKDKTLVEKAARLKALADVKTDQSAAGRKTQAQKSALLAKAKQQLPAAEKQARDATVAVQAFQKQVSAATAAVKPALNKADAAKISAAAKSTLVSAAQGAIVQLKDDVAFALKLKQAGG